MSLRVRPLIDSIYEIDIVLLVGPLRDLRPWLEQHGYATDAGTSTWAQGKTWETTSAAGSTWVIWLPPAAAPSTIAHEAVRLAVQILRYVDVPLTRASEEAYAYYVSAMFDQMTAALARRPARRRKGTRTR